MHTRKEVQPVENDGIMHDGVCRMHVWGIGCVGMDVPGDGISETGGPRFVLDAGPLLREGTKT
jgi:hypothetical protein